MRLPSSARAFALLLAGTSASAQTADRIWQGGPILTMNDQAMRAEAIAEAGGRILAVGSRAQVMKLKGANTRMIDLKGRALVPGFVDPHGHIFLGGLQALSANIQSPPDGKVTDIPSLLATVKAWVAENQAQVKAAGLIVGFGYDNAQFKEQRHPTKEELDQISTDLPVILVHQSGHLATLNSAGLKAIGVDSSSQDPAGGVIQRKPGTTEPNGTLEEAAIYPIASKLLPRIGPEGMKAFAREGHRAAQARFPEGSTQRHVLIHGQFMRADQVGQFKELGVIPSLFPMHSFYWGDWHLDHTVGPEAGMNISPTGWVLKQGMIFTTHHDAPVAFPDSMRVLDATVTRRARGSGRIVGPDHRVDVITALKAMTIWPAYQQSEEATKGSLEPGKLADFAILSADPTAVKPETIAELKVSETVKEGKTIFTLAGARPVAAASDIMPLIRALAGPAGEGHAGHGHGAGDCPSDLMLAIASAMASGQPDTRP